MESSSTPYRKMLSMAISAILLEAGFDDVQKDCLATLLELLQCLLVQIGDGSRSYCELACRCEPILADTVMAFIDIGVNCQALPDYVKRRQKHHILPQLMPQQPHKQINMLTAGQRQSLPSHIGQHFPSYPDPHAYIRTPTHKQPVIDYESVREKAAAQKRDVEKALTKFLAKTSTVHNLFDSDEANIFPLIASKPPVPVYLSALIPQDQIFDQEDLENDHKSQMMEQAKEQNQKNKKKEAEHEETDENLDENASLNDSGKSDENSTSIPIDNPYLVAAKLPQFGGG